MSLRDDRYAIPEQHHRSLADAEEEYQEAANRAEEAEAQARDLRAALDAIKNQTFECRICGRPCTGAPEGTRLCDPCEDALLGTPAGEALLTLRSEVGKIMGTVMGIEARWRETPGYAFAADEADRVALMLQNALYPPAAKSGDAG